MYQSPAARIGLGLLNKSAFVNSLDGKNLKFQGEVLSISVYCCGMKVRRVFRVVKFL
ncbi:Unknown protein sequence [Pseudomonas amygdali pv. myricae]|nr:hypothetical protein AC519_3495 [Pseudomonas savastanoi]KPB57136.1 Unknown protein sequence [Pseudomonas amygdali pv. myricae]